MLKSAGWYYIPIAFRASVLYLFRWRNAKNLLAMFLLSDAAGVDWPTMACYWLQNNTRLVAALSCANLEDFVGAHGAELYCSRKLRFFRHLWFVFWQLWTFFAQVWKLYICIYIHIIKKYIYFFKYIYIYMDGVQNSRSQGLYGLRKVGIGKLILHFGYVAGRN